MSKNFETIGQKEQKLLDDALNHLSQQLSSPQLAQAFVDKLLTKKERLTIARRLLISSMIQRGETYMAINEKLAVSPNTFTNIKKWIEEELPDYSTVLEHTETAARKRALSRQRKKPDRKDYGKPLSYQRLKHTYPAHFLLFSLAETVLSKLK